MNDELCLVYITTKDFNEAQKISEFLINKKLIACSNIIKSMTSNYFWDNKLETGHECILILKTKNNYFNKIESAVYSLHSYDCPCIFSLPIQNIGSKYKAWLNSQLGE